MGNQESRYQVILTEEDLKNATILLERVELTGKEVPAYVRIQRALINAKKENNDIPKDLKEMKPVENDKIPVDNVD